MADRLQARQNPLAEAVKQVRHVALTLLALILLLRQILGLTHSTNTMRLVERIFWLVIIYVGLTFSGIRYDSHQYWARRRMYRLPWTAEASGLSAPLRFWEETRRFLHDRALG